MGRVPCECFNDVARMPQCIDRLLGLPAMHPLPANDLLAELDGPEALRLRGLDETDQRFHESRHILPGRQQNHKDQGASDTVRREDSLNGREVHRFHVLPT